MTLTLFYSYIPYQTKNWLKLYIKNDIVKVKHQHCHLKVATKKLTTNKMILSLNFLNNFYNTKITT